LKRKQERRHPMKAKYYLIEDKYLGKQENLIYYLLGKEGWCVDNSGYIAGKLFGYDESDDDTPYAMGNTDIMDQIREISKDEVNEVLTKLGQKNEPRFSAGQFVRYNGPDLAAYEKGKVYRITGYDEKLNLFKVMSESDEEYLLEEEMLEELSDEEENKYDAEFYEALFEEDDDND